MSNSTGILEVAYALVEFLFDEVQSFKGHW